MRRLGSTLTLCLMLCVSGVTNAFNELGHSVIAKVAYDKLTPVAADGDS